MKIGSISNFIEENGLISNRSLFFGQKSEHTRFVKKLKLDAGFVKTMGTGNNIATF